MEDGSPPQRHAFPAGFGMVMAECMRQLGQPQFYETAAEMVRRVIPSDFWIIAQYETQARPRILSETGMAPDARDEYSNTLWRLDPLPRRFGNDRAAAVSLAQIRAAGDIPRAFDRYVERSLGIVDELALLLPMGEGSFLALCLDRMDATFGAAELQMALELQEVLAELHRQHIDRVVDHQVTRLLHEHGMGASEVMVLGANTDVLYRSDAWDWAARQAFERVPSPAQIHRNAGADTPGNDGWMLSRFDQTEGPGLHPGAEIFLLRRVESGLAAQMERFATRHGLTPRQSQIVERSVLGQSNAAIAGALGITVGSVKNHKLRIYEKLDITSERELISAVVAGLAP